MKEQKRYSRELKERAVRMVLEHGREYASQWLAIISISSKIGCTAETLRRLVRLAEVEMGRRGGLVLVVNSGHQKIHAASLFS